ncbi:hypothetical protein EJ110_NYTH34636 [Nymphaea thermarum]|nr:hypothetical protein EJ110_NYTH34636 [Nymphaea thermarum]
MLFLRYGGRQICTRELVGAVSFSKTKSVPVSLLSPSLSLHFLLALFISRVTGRRVGSSPSLSLLIRGSDKINVCQENS